MDFTDRRDEARRFLRALYGNVPGDVGLFMLPGAHSIRLPSDDLDAVAHEAVQASLAEQTNIYLTCCLLTPGSGSRGGRGAAEDAAVIPGVWVDLDIAGAAHKSSALPPTQEVGLELLREMAAAPTFVVDSGWGLYGWWLFDRPRPLLDAGARDRAHRMVLGTQEALRRLAAPHGWTVDPTGDLARVLRLPGTTNWKIDGDPRPVRVLHHTGQRYEPEQLFKLWGDLAPSIKGPAAPLPERVTAGQRTNSVASLAGTLRRRNVVEAAAEAAALEHNRLVCDPPLPDGKVVETVRGIYKRYDPAAVPAVNGNGSANGHGKGRPAGGLRAELAFLDRVVRRPIEFVWEPGIIRGGLTLLAGDPGMGKGLVATALVAAMTAGIEVPGRRPEAGEVLWLSYEESEATAICPRLDVAGADTSKVAKLVIEREEGRQDRFFRAEDIPLLGRTLAACPNVRLIVLDPVMSFMGGGTDINQGNSVRDALGPLVDLADQFGIGLLGIAHVNKAELMKTLYRVSNSVAFTALARSVIGVGQLEDGRRALAHVKANYTAAFVPVPFTITGIVHPTTGQSVGRVVWDEPDEEIDVTRLFDDRRPDKKDKSKNEECAEAILQLLGGQKRFAQEIKDELFRRGFSEKTIQNGRRLAGVQTTGGGPNTRWVPPGLTVGGDRTEGHAESLDLTDSAARSYLPPTSARADALDLEEGDA